jgi:chromosome segregation protein
MRLAKVTLSGFKSFADATEFRFDQPITGIVGPNGCGKSNVVDAIKWVLGERSAKSLRGDAMIDVVFAGSAARKPMGAASVTLSFDNPIITHHAFNLLSEDDSQLRFRIDDEQGDRLDEASGNGTHHEELNGTSHNGVTPRAHQRYLNIDTEQVDVTRRLYRDGRSEYLINGKKVRLRDIKELFMDTGIGTHAYSIIEQGRVDAMLMANPIERRSILEEAAGVAKFKARKIEAQRKLERSEVNLVRVREQLENTERRLRIVKGQAAKARKFKELDERYRELRVALALDQYHELRERLDGLTSRLADLDERRAEMTELLGSLEDDKQEAEIARHELQQKQRDIEQNRLQLIATRKHAEQRRELTQRNLGETKTHIEEDRERLKELALRLEAFEQKLEDAASEIASAAEQVAEAERRVSSLNDERAKEQQTLMNARDALDDAKDDHRRIENQRNQIDRQVEAMDGRINGLKEQIDRLSEKRSTLDRERAQSHEQQAQTESRRVFAQKAVQQLEQRLDEFDREAAKLGERQAAIADKLSDLRHERAGIESRRHLLEEMQDARDGLADSVKTVLDAPDQFPGVRGLLGDAIDTDRKHAPLVEAALGENLELLLFDRFEDLQKLQAQLRELPGRVGFMVTEWFDGVGHSAIGNRQPMDESLPAAEADDSIDGESARHVPEHMHANADAPAESLSTPSFLDRPDRSHAPEVPAGWGVPILSLIRVQPHARHAIERLLAQHDRRR